MNKIKLVFLLIITITSSFGYSNSVSIEVFCEHNCDDTYSICSDEDGNHCKKLEKKHNDQSYYFKDLIPISNDHKTCLYIKKDDEDSSVVYPMSIDDGNYKKLCLQYGELKKCIYISSPLEGLVIEKDS